MPQSPSPLLAPCPFCGNEEPRKRMTKDDIEYMRRMADEYDALLERWKHASAGSQEVANLHATFKARGGDIGRMVENGLFRRVLAALAAAGVGGLEK